MPVFDPGQDLAQRMDFQLLINGPVTLFWRRSVIESTCAWLVGHGYDVVRLKADLWWSEEDAHASMASALSFPDYYGANLDAFNDCLRDVASGAYGLTPEGSGLTLVLLGFDSFAGRLPNVAHSILDIVACQSRTGLLLGNRLMCLVQSDNSMLDLGPVGATPVSWNNAELSDRGRGRGTGAVSDG